MTSESILLDKHSLRILAELQRDARQTVQQIAAAVGLSSTPCWRRIKEMEAAGVIRGYTILVDRRKVGLGIAVVVEVNLDRHSEQIVQRFEREVLTCPNIVRCVQATGSSDYILNVLVPDIEHYERFLQDTMFTLPGVTHVRSSIVLKEVKADVAIPIGASAAARRSAA